MDNTAENKQTLPRSTAALVLGICSIVFCGVIGLAAGIIGLVQSKKAMEIYAQNTALYTEGSFQNAKAGKICSIIGIVLSAIGTILIFVFLWLGLFSAAGTAVMLHHSNAAVAI